MELKDKLNCVDPWGATPTIATNHRMSDRCNLVQVALSKGGTWQRKLLDERACSGAVTLQPPAMARGVAVELCAAASVR